MILININNAITFNNDVKKFSHLDSIKKNIDKLNLFSFPKIKENIDKSIDFFSPIIRAVGSVKNITHLKYEENLEYVLKNFKIDINEFNQIIQFDFKKGNKVMDAIIYLNEKGLIQDKDFSSSNMTKKLIDSVETFYQIDKFREKNNTSLDFKSFINEDLKDELYKFSSAKLELKYYNSINYLSEFMPKMEVLKSSNLKIDVPSLMSIENNNLYDELNNIDKFCEKFKVKLTLHNGLDDNNIENLKFLSNLIKESNPKDLLTIKNSLQKFSNESKNINQNLAPIDNLVSILQNDVKNNFTKTRNVLSSQQSSLSL